MNLHLRKPKLGQSSLCTLGGIWGAFRGAKFIGGNFLGYGGGRKLKKNFRLKFAWTLAKFGVKVLFGKIFGGTVNFGPPSAAQSSYEPTEAQVGPKFLVPHILQGGGAINGNTYFVFDVSRKRLELSG